ncbi:UNVERIFIED_CONTAM: hypothetical protein RF648_21415, partial [Kocuria sp. CPCC 205274]
PPAQQYDSSGHLISNVAAGMMLHHVLSNRASVRPVVNNKTVVVKKYYSAPKRYYGSRRNPIRYRGR